MNTKKKRIRDRTNEKHPHHRWCKTCDKLTPIDRMVKCKKCKELVCYFHAGSRLGHKTTTEMKDMPKMCFTCFKFDKDPSTPRVDALLRESEDYEYVKYKRPVVLRGI